jgi:hypothetical protein
MKNWLIRFIRQEMKILHAKCLIKHFGRFDENLNFTPNSIQKIINIMMLGCGPNINMEVLNTFLQKFLQSKLENDGARCNFSISTFIEAGGD